MVGSPYVPQQKICQKLVKTLQEGKRGAVGLDMADVCFVWRLYMPSGASLVCSMDPSNVLKHCHNNGWLYLFHNRKFAKSLSRLSRKEKGGQLAWIWLMFVVIGGCTCLLVPPWFVPWTLAMY